MRVLFLSMTLRLRWWFLLHQILSHILQHRGPEMDEPYKQNEVTGIWGIFRGYTDVRMDALQLGRGPAPSGKRPLQT